MKKYVFHAVKFLVFLGLGILLCWLAVRGLKEEDIAQIKRSIAEANYAWIALAMLAGMLAHLSRAMRWKMLLEPLGFTPKTTNTFYAVMIGYLGNLVPPRVGEVLRCGILKRYEKIPFTQSFGTVIIERIIDTLVLVLFLLMTAWLEYKRMHDLLSEYIFTPIKAKLHSIVENKIWLLLTMAALISIGFAFFFLRKKLIQNPVFQKILALLKSFLEGIQTVARVKSPALFIFHTVFIWTMYLMSVYLCVFAFNETKGMTISNCIVLMALGSIGVIVSPGGVGAYQLIVLQIMLLWGYTTAMGVAFGWIVWSAQTSLVLVTGLLSFGLLAIFNKEEGLEE